MDFVNKCFLAVAMLLAYSVSIGALYSKTCPFCIYCGIGLLALALVVLRVLRRARL